MRDDVRPDVLIVGGFLTEPFMYGPLRDRLLARGAASVAIAPVHVADWLAAGLAGLAPLQVRTALAVVRTHRRSGRPLLVIGHSGGGILARLAMVPVAYQGRLTAVADRVGCLVTLGTPHGMARTPVTRRHPGVEAAAFLDRVMPGAWGAPETATITVGSTAVPPTAWDRASRRARWRNAPFRAVVGPIGPAGGDGIVGVSLAHLEGARQLTLTDATHGTVGDRWYGDDAVIDGWWPVAVEAWRDALAARRVRGASAGRAAGPETGEARAMATGQPAGALADQPAGVPSAEA